MAPGTPPNSCSGPGDSPGLYSPDMSSNLALKVGVNLGPRSCYEEGKRFGEALCKAYRDEYGVDVRIGRIFNSYGPRLRAEGFYGRVVSRFILQCLKGEDVTVFGDGSQTRSFCYVTDSVTGILSFTGRKGPSGEVLNLGTDEERKILDPCRDCQEAFGLFFRHPFPSLSARRSQATPAGHEEVHQVN